MVPSSTAFFSFQPEEGMYMRKIRNMQVFWQLIQIGHVETLDMHRCAVRIAPLHRHCHRVYDGLSNHNVRGIMNWRS